MLTLICSTSCVFRYLAAVVVSLDLSVIGGSSLRIGEVLYIVAHHKDDLIGHHSLINEVKNDVFNHLTNDDLGFIEGVRSSQYLTGAYTCGFGLICFDAWNVHRLPAPRLINDIHGVFAEFTVESFSSVREQRATSPIV